MCGDIGGDENSRLGGGGLTLLAGMIGMPLVFIVGLLSDPALIPWPPGISGPTILRGTIAPPRTRAGEAEGRRSSLETNSGS